MKIFKAVQNDFAVTNYRFVLRGLKITDDGKYLLFGGHTADDSIYNPAVYTMTHSSPHDPPINNWAASTTIS